MSSGGLAYEAVGQIAKMLRVGAPSPRVLELLADCLAREHQAFTSFTVASIRSGRGNSPVHALIADYVEMKDESACLSLLRIARPPHRPKEEDREFRMLEAYMCAIERGASDEDAIAGAYAARGGWNIDKDRTTFKARGIRSRMTVYDYRVSEKLRPFLNKYGRDNT
jgi:hypothetical protein